MFFLRPTDVNAVRAAICVVKAFPTLHLSLFIEDRRKRERGKECEEETWGMED